MDIYIIYSSSDDDSSGTSCTDDDGDISVNETYHHCGKGEENSIGKGRRV